MITIIEGVSGSGKSLYAVNKIYNNFSSDKEAIRDKKATYDICYTNINEFEFEKVDNVYPLDFEDLEHKLFELHSLYKDKVTDDVLIEKCKEYNIYNALFVIDECQNYFDVENKVLVWWLSYHRHLYHEIILITQSVSLIHLKYKKFSEFFFRAKPRSLTLFKTHFTYNVYTHSRMSQNTKSGTIKLKGNKKLFELYKSGDSINTENVLLRFIYFGAFFLFLTIAILYYYVSSKTPDISDQNVTYPAKNNVTLQLNKTVTDQHNNSNYAAVESQITIQDPTNRKFFDLTCNNTNCYNEDILLPLALLEYFIKNQSITFFYSVKINKNSSKFYLDSTEDFYRYISNKRRENEDYKTNSDDPVPVSSMFNGK